MNVLSKCKIGLKTYIPARLWLFAHKTRYILRGITAMHISHPLFRRLALFKFQISTGKKITAYFANAQIRKVQLGAGSNRLLGWLNSEAFTPSSFTHSLHVADDYIFLDVCRSFPFEDNSVDYIFHEHVIEHLNYQQGQFMLKECFRVLRPGGRMRVATPDLQFFVGLYETQASTEQQLFLNEYVRFNSGIWSADLKHVRNNETIFVLNHALRAWGHLFMYDYPTLVEALNAAEFVEMERQSPQRSRDNHLCNLELRKEIVGILDALIVEAIKPRFS